MPSIEVTQTCVEQRGRHPGAGCDPSTASKRIMEGYSPQRSRCVRWKRRLVAPFRQTLSQPMPMVTGTESATHPGGGIDAYGCTAGEPDTGLLVVGHGSRDPAGMGELRVMIERVRQMAGTMPVEAGFLEFAEPTVRQAAVRLAQRGIRRIRVAPLLLFAAGHATRDIPLEMAAGLADFPQVTWLAGRPLESHPAMVRLARIRLFEAIAARPLVGVGSTAWLLVGRGSHDQEATFQMHRFAERVARAMPIAAVQACFAAMAEPRLSTALQSLLKSRKYDTIVVQPHLLFRGLLLEEISAVVGSSARDLPPGSLRIARHLGPARAIARAVIERAAAATNRGRRPLPELHAGVATVPRPQPQDRRTHRGTSGDVKHFG